MKRAILLLAVLAMALSLAGSPALAQSDDATGGTAPSSPGIEPLETRPETAPTTGLTAPLSEEDGELKPSRDTQRVSAATTASTPKWLMGSSSNTYVYTPFFGVETFTMEWAGYWGTEDASYPRVAELSDGRVVIGNSNPTFDASVAPEALLPPNTQLAIQPDDPNRRVLCYLTDTNPEPDATAELTGDNCTQTPFQGYWGARFVPKRGYWTLSAGQMLSVIFPIVSTAVLSGTANAPASYLIGAFEVAGAIDNDAPEPGDRCPTANGDGAWQGVFVAFNPPTIAYPRPSTTNITATGAHSTAHLFSHFNGGTAFFDLGTTTAYNRSISVTIPGDGDAWEVFHDWTGFAPATT